MRLSRMFYFREADYFSVRSCLTYPLSTMFPSGFLAGWAERTRQTSRQVRQVRNNITFLTVKTWCVLMFWARLRLRRAQNIFMPKKIKTEKNDNKTVWIIFFSLALWENVNKLWNGFSILIGCLDRTIIWFSFFIGLFERAKIYFSPPNSPF